MKGGLTILRTRSQRERVFGVMQALAGVSCRCPAHSTPHSHSSQADTRSTDYAYEIASSSVRIGRGVSREVGMDLVNRGLKRVLLFTDKNVREQLAFSTVRDALKREDVQFEIFDEVRVEPTDKSVREAIHFTQRGQFDGFVAVGGGSVMDTSKVARLFDTYRDKDLLDFVHPPLGKGEPILKTLKPLVCIPTTSGTGSESTGAAIFNIQSENIKTGFSNRGLYPSLALIDPYNTLSMPKNVKKYTGFDLLCHALEAYTTLPYHVRTPFPTNPKFRPGDQGSNPVSDIWSKETLKICCKHFYNSVESIEDIEASSQMSFAALLGGFGFGSGGVHLCHALSYGIACVPKQFSPSGYPEGDPIIPHGLAVVLTAPAVFNQVGHVWPDRCIELAGLLGANSRSIKTEDAGRCLSDQICKLMDRLSIPNGLSALGLKEEDIPVMVEKTVPHERITKLAPNPVDESFLSDVLLRSLTVYD